MRVVIKKDYADCSEWTANYIARRILDANPTEQRPFVLGLPTGSTPIGVYEHLVKLYNKTKISFKNVVTFNMDEYVGLADDHPQSYHYFMYDHFFKHIDIKKENIHILNGLAKNPEEECAAYEKAIKAYGGIDLFLGGIGSDGHIAFNEPGSSLTSRTRVMTLTQETIAANSRFFEGDLSKVPTRAFTVGVGTICDAREVIIMVTDRSKAKALAQGVEGAVSQMWPITALQLHQNAIIACTDDATDELKVGTVRYFNNMESHYPVPEV